MPTPKLQLAIPQLPTGDLDKTAQFFVAKLGFEIAAMLPDHGHLSIQRDGMEIHFWLVSTEQAAKEIAEQSSCYIRTENIEPLFEEFRLAGATFGYELSMQPWGMNEMQVNDPYGNAIRFGEAITNG